MKLLFRLLTLYMAVPVVELFFLWQVNRLFGYWTGGYGWILTGALIIATAVAGSYLAKREGLSAWERLQGSFSGGGLPTDEILDAVIILVAGVLLITPGVLTDFVGFVGLVPFTRRGVRALVKRRLKKAMREGRLQTSFGSFGTFGGGFETGDMPGDDPSPFGDGEASVGGTPATHGPAAQPRPSAEPEAEAPASPTRSLAGREESPSGEQASGGPASPDEQPGEAR